MKRKLITVTDILLIGIALIGAAAVLLSAAVNTSDRLVAEIICGDTVRTVALYSVNEEYEEEIFSNGHTVTLKISHNSVRVAASTCRDSVCVAAGELNKNGDCAVCLPALLTVRVYSERDDDSGVDAVL